MTPAVRALLEKDTFSPYRLPNNAAVYSVQGGASDSTYLVSGGTCSLIADRSGNSSVNELVLNGSVAGNYAMGTTASVFGTGDFSVSAKVRFYSFASEQCLLNGGNNSFVININVSGYAYTGKVAVAANTPSTTQLTTFTDYVICYTRSGTTGTYYVNGVAAGTITDNLNYSVASPSIGGQTDGLKIVYGNMRWMRHYSVALTPSQVAADAAGTVQSSSTYDVDFSLVSKMATSFTATKGGTVTVYSSGDFGARIAGARDLVQLTAIKQPAFSTGADGINILTFDGSNDYMKAAPFSLSQPTTTHFVGSLKTWTSGDYLIDGNATNSGAIIQTTGTPQVNLNAGSSVAANTDAALATRVCWSAIINGASSSLRVNRLAATTGNAGAANMNGSTLFARGAGDANYGNGTFCAEIIRSVADDPTTELRIKSALMKECKVAA